MINAEEAYKRSFIHTKCEKWKKKVEKAILEATERGEYSVDMIFCDEEKCSVNKVAEDLKELDYFVNIKLHGVRLGTLSEYDLYACDYNNYLYISWLHKRFAE